MWDLPSASLRLSYLDLKCLVESLALRRWCSVYIYWPNYRTRTSDEMHTYMGYHYRLYWSSCQQLDKTSQFLCKVLFIIMLPRLIFYVCLHPSYCASDKMETSHLNPHSLPFTAGIYTKSAFLYPKLPSRHKVLLKIINDHPSRVN